MTFILPKKMVSDQIGLFHTMNYLLIMILSSSFAEYMAKKMILRKSLMVNILERFL